MTDKTHAQNGNAIVLVLIGIVLFAALSYAVSKSTRVASNLGNSEKQDTQVTDLLQSATVLTNAVRSVMLSNGCTEAQISFENSVVTGYANAAAPSDKSCHIFNPAGGNITYQKPLLSILDTTFQSATYYNQLFFSGRYCVIGVGTGAAWPCDQTQTELMLFIPGIKKEVCQGLDVKLNIIASGANPPEDTFSYTKFTGSYYDASLGELGDPVSVALKGKSVGCVKITGGNPADMFNNYMFYAVLLPR